MTKTIGVVAKRDSKEIVAAGRRICEIIRNLGLAVVPEEELARSGKIPGGKPLKHIKADLMVTLGGDGTVLKVAREMRDRDTPIFGVNMGQRGILTEVDPDGFEKAFSRWMTGDFQLEKLWKVSVLVNNHLVGEGLNEALMTPTVPAKMLRLEISLGGKKLFTVRADGLIVATPTGSTAHSFSAGGPVLEGSLNDLVMSFIAPLQPVRSLVVPSNENLRVRVDKPGQDANLSIDGRLERKVGLGQSVLFRKSSNSTLFVRFGDSFLQRSLRRLAPEKETL
jgi:NAD+ kinase